MVMSTAIFSAPCTPKFVDLGRDITASWGAWRIVAFFGHVFVEIRSVERTFPSSACGVAVLLVYSRDAFLTSFCLRILLSEACWWVARVVKWLRAFVFGRWILACFLLRCRSILVQPGYLRTIFDPSRKELKRRLDVLSVLHPSKT